MDPALFIYAIHTYIHTHVYVYVCTYIYIYTCVYVCVCVHVCIIARTKIHFARTFDVKCSRSAPFSTFVMCPARTRALFTVVHFCHFGHIPARVLRLHFLWVHKMHSHTRHKVHLRKFGCNCTRAIEHNGSQQAGCTFAASAEVHLLVHFEF